MGGGGNECKELSGGYGGETLVPAGESDWKAFGREMSCGTCGNDGGGA